ncbi:hypothetical protein Tco_1396421, partial [Tanacetum coccineum]
DKTTREKEEVHEEEVEMDKIHDVDHLDSKEALQCDLAKDPIFVFIEPKDQSNFM